MAGRFLVDPTVLEDTAKQIFNISVEYEKQYLDLYSKVEELKQAWQGVDANDYIQKITNYKGNFETMKLAMSEYARFIQIIANQYKDAQQKIKREAVL